MPCAGSCASLVVIAARTPTVAPCSRGDSRAARAVVERSRGRSKVRTSGSVPKSVSPPQTGVDRGFAANEEFLQKKICGDRHVDVPGVLHQGILSLFEDDPSLGFDL